MSKLIVALLILSVFVPASAQQWGDNDLLACNTSQFTVLRDAISALREDIHVAIRQNTVSAYESLRTRFNSQHMNSFPTCHYGSFMESLYANYVRDLLIMSLYGEGGNQTLYGQYFVTTLASAAIIEAMEEPVFTGALEAATASDRTSNEPMSFSGSGEDVLGPLELRSGLYRIRVTLEPDRGGAAVYVRHVSGQSIGSQYIGANPQPGSAGSFVVTIREQGRYVIAIDPPSAGKWAIEITLLE